MNGTIKERLSVLETNINVLKNEIKALRKLLYVMITVILGQAGTHLIPLVEAALS